MGGYAEGWVATQRDRWLSVEGWVSTHRDRWLSRGMGGYAEGRAAK
jgi:hypothetical protein